MRTCLVVDDSSVIRKVARRILESLDFQIVEAEDGKTPMAVGVDLRGESYGLLIDQIGEVLRLPDDGREENPVNLDPRMAKLAGGVHRLDGQLMDVLDIDRVL